ncbi:UDP-4-amino-4,6-dideoxy-N-acetyl-beta-L-altrosamine N-acetyltransferase [Endozoicomonas numazuensis]|uniref:UDP-4-amino-4, 6-dideoxy-N-acetyl-beta-L-altrosamine N-acetyltransferase n=1 Tax=Endozoicomonas numazuensis TaxID=1137799 RepID=UPI0009DFE6B7|nr:UDP-4-amino-4,6-dideoxy-N-acetyl-beta-L-altrosamine N-acetyltransferase [Endozoicomonas numazuensis]
MSSLSPQSIELVLLVSLDTEQQMKVRDIRNEEKVRKWMYTDHLISANEHLGWINRLKNDDQQITFAVMGDGSEILGVVSLNAIDSLHKKADWAFYLTESSRGGLGSALEFSFINFVFEQLEMEKLNCEVIEGNDAVVKLHKKFLFQEEGFRRSNIIKNSDRKGVHSLGLTKDEWQSGKKAVREKYSTVFEKFSINIQWQNKEETPRHPIDQIESARAKNNLNWMSILRLALEKSPETAKPIIDEIKHIDREISTLTDKLTAPDPSSTD